MDTNIKNDILEIIISHIYNTYFYQLSKLEIDDKKYIKSQVKLNMWNLPLDITKLEKFIFNRMIKYLDHKIKSFDAGLYEDEQYLCISREFNEYDNQTIYDIIEIIYNDDSYDYYYNHIFNIKQTMIILYALRLSREEKYINMIITIIEYYIYNLDYI